MLVVRRRVGETILVGDEVEIEIIEISRSRVKLGVRAPCNISVIRKETLAVSQENQLASDLISTRGHDGVGELLQLLKQPDLNQPGLGLNETSGKRGYNETGFNERFRQKHDSATEGSTKPGRRRYVTSERYSGYRGSRENPHPA